MAETRNTGSSRIIPSECPMHADNVKPVTPPSECPMHTDNVKQSVQPSECPMHADNGKEAPINPTNMMPPPNQQPSPNQPFELNTARQISSIPKGGEAKDGEKWEYPSEQMFWNAMLRKGWRWEKDQVSRTDMSHIIRIHNHNNERAWNEVLTWEKFSGSNINDIKLVKFGGKAKEYSPRARIRAAMGYDLPFDRHDWIIDRNGKPVRYVIDYYDTGDENGYKTGEFVDLDVRPAFDSFGAAYDRSRAALLRWAAGAINWWRQPKET